VTEFTFLVGIPTMFAASAHDTWKSYKAGELHGVGHQILIDTAIGFVISMIVAFFVVKWLLRFVQSHTFNGFAIYRVLLGGGLLIALYTGAIPDVTNEKESVKETPLLTAPGTNSAPVAPAAPATSTPAETNATPVTPATSDVPVQPLAPATNAAPVAPIPTTNADAKPFVPANAAFTNGAPDSQAPLTTQ
jgi:hypothetical protein